MLAVAPPLREVTVPLAQEDGCGLGSGAWPSESPVLGLTLGHCPSHRCVDSKPRPEVPGSREPAPPLLSPYLGLRELPTLQEAPLFLPHRPSSPWAPPSAVQGPPRRAELAFETVILQRWQRDSMASYDFVPFVFMTFF